MAVADPTEPDELVRMPRHRACPTMAAVRGGSVSRYGAILRDEKNRSATREASSGSPLTGLPKYFCASVTT